MEKQFLSRDEAASMSGLSISTIDRLIVNGELAAVRPTGKKRGRVLIRLADINAFLASRSTHAIPASIEPIAPPPPIASA